MGLLMSGQVSLLCKFFAAFLTGEHHHGLSKAQNTKDDSVTAYHSQKSWVILLMNIHKPNRVIYDISK